MRNSFAFAITAVLAACGTESMTADDTGDDDTTPVAAFEVTSSDITLQPGEEVTKCFYFHTPNTETIKVNKWVSDLTPGSHHMIMFSALGGTQPPDGTVDDCNSGVAIPVFGTQVEHEEVNFPADDGHGNPLAQLVTPNTAGYFQMHYLNSSDQPLTAHVTLKAFALPDTVEKFTRTDLFATYNNDIAIPPHATDFVVSATCGVVDAQFWSMSTHSHKQSVHTRVAEGATTVLESDDWEHPTNLEFAGPEFYKFSSGSLTWECTYSNTGDNADTTVRAGQSAQTNEMCMATGYYFPATGPKGCFMNGGQCQCLL